MIMSKQFLERAGLESQTLDVCLEQEWLLPAQTRWFLIRPTHLRQNSAAPLLPIHDTAVPESGGNEDV